MMQLCNKSLRNFAHKEKLEGMILHCIMVSDSTKAIPLLSTPAICGIYLGSLNATLLAQEK